MITILQKERWATGPWCIACVQTSGPADKTICDLCLGYIATYWRCPRCQMIDHYYGHDEARVCGCGYILPSIDDLKFDRSARVMYQVAEELHD